MKNFLIVFAAITFAAVLAACEQKATETAADAAGKTPDAAVVPVEADAATAKPEQTAPELNELPSVLNAPVPTEAAAGPVADTAK